MKPITLNSLDLSPDWKLENINPIVSLLSTNMCWVALTVLCIWNFLRLEFSYLPFKYGGYLAHIRCADFKKQKADIISAQSPNRSTEITKISKNLLLVLKSPINCFAQNSMFLQSMLCSRCSPTNPLIEATENYDAPSK